MGFFRRFFSKGNTGTEKEDQPIEEDTMLSTLQDQYQRDIEEDVSSIQSILGDEEDQPEPLVALPAPDYDEHDVSVDDVLKDSEMGNFSEKNVVEHSSVEELGNHLESAPVMGDLPSEVSFDSKE